MSYNGSGTFQINTSGQPVVAGTVISSTAFNALTADLATGLSTAITKDGQTTTTARIPFAAGINSSLVTDSTNTTSGSIITAGGVGIAKALFVGTTANVAGAVTLQGALGVTGVTTVQAGTAALPAITTSGDTNTGIFFPAADTIAFTEGGAEAMRITSAGDVGIGTTSPNSYTGYTTLTLNNPTNGSVVDLNVNGTRTGSFLAESTKITIASITSIPLAFNTNNTERARIDSSGNLLVGVTSGTTFHIIKKAVSTDGSFILDVRHDGAGPNSTFYAVTSASTPNAANSAFSLGRAATTRSINAAGTINASGADYAEYMTKDGDFNVAKGDVVGINAQGKLTNVFAHAISFVVKSTDPSYVGGDVWGTPVALGLSKLEDDATDEEKATFNTALEAARQTVDRIAFAGQVPVNVTGATAGQYIIPVNNNGAIKGEAVSNPTFEQYQIAIGKVIAIESDGRAKIIVKVA